MTERDIPQGQCPDADPSMMTRSEALREALKARRPPEPDREFSTLVERSEPLQDGHDEHGWIEHTGPIDRSSVTEAELVQAAGLNRLLDAVDSYVATSPAKLAGGANGEDDEVEDERGAVPDAAASGEHDQAQRRDQE